MEGTNLGILLKCRLIHLIPGRVRINCTALKYMRRSHSTLLEQIVQTHGVQHIEFSGITTNILIFYDTKVLNAQEVVELTESLISTYSYNAVKTFRNEKNQVLVKERELHHESIATQLRNIAVSAGLLLLSSLTKIPSLPLIPGLGMVSKFNLVATLFLAKPIFSSGLHSLRTTQRPNADTLSSAAIVANLLTGNTQSVLVMLLLHDSAEFLTTYTMDRTRKQIGDMLSKGEEFVWKEGPKGKVEKISVNQTQVGDVVIVHTGEKISVDGEVVSGTALVDQASITGEAMPISAQKGTLVFAGTLVKNGTIKIQTQKVGDETTVAKIITMVEEASEHKAQVQVYADRYSSQLLLLNFFLAGAVYAFTRDSLRALSMLVIDFSCGIRLSTAAAFSAAINTLAKNGVLVKGSSYLEILADADTLILDKTGTITRGEPEVTSVIPANHKEHSSDKVLALAAAVEETSTHPMANAILGNPRNAHTH